MKTLTDPSNSYRSQIGFDRLKMQAHRPAFPLLEISQRARINTLFHSLFGGVL